MECQPAGLNWHNLTEITGTIKPKWVAQFEPCYPKANKVEVIIFPVEEQKEQSSLKNSERFSGAISKKTADKLHKHLNKVRNEWEEQDIY